MRQDTVSPAAARFAVEVVPDCVVAGCDGSELAGDLFLPRTTEPVPCLVTLLPYNKDGLAGVTGWQANHFLASQGYASLVVDSRGTGASPGLPRAPFDPDEGGDGAAVVGWAAKQPWCDGGVGMWGVSYAATTALRTASLRPPALKAIAVVMGLLDPERDFVHPAGRRGGLASLGMWGLNTLAQHLLPPLRADPTGALERRWRARLETGRPFVVDLLEHEPGDAAWRDRVVDAARIVTPALCVAGWRDLSCDATIRAYEHLAGPKRLVVGPWMHTLPDESPFEPVGFLSMAIAWWDRWLRPQLAAAPHDPPVTVYLQRRRRWLGLASWPPDGLRTRMNASADDRLVHDFPPVEGEVERPVDPTVGVRGGLWSVPTRGFGLPRDQHEDDARSLAFTSEALEGPLVLCGRPVATVAVDAAPGSAVVAKLTHVADNGASTLITSGVASVEGEPVLRVELIPTAYEVPAGDRLRLVIAGADFPRLWPARQVERQAVRCGLAVTFVDLPLLNVEAVDEGAEPALPPPFDGGGVPSLVLRAEPLYTVASNALRDATTVAVGDHLVLKTPLEERTLDIHGFVVASVTADRPSDARVCGRSTTRVSTARGRYVVRAEIELTADGASISGEVSRQGRTEFSRRWTRRVAASTPR